MITIRKVELSDQKVNTNNTWKYKSLVNYWEMDLHPNKEISFCFKDSANFYLLFISLEQGLSSRV